MKIHLLMPMSGRGERFRAAGYVDPKPLIRVSGTPMVVRLLRCFPEHWPAHFVLSEEQRSRGLSEVLKEERPDSRISFIAPHRSGPSHAVSQVLQSIPEEEAVFVSYCDYGMRWSAAEFERFVKVTDCDACLISYRGFHPHYLRSRKFAYSRMVGERVVEVREKGWFTSDPESEFASAGGYYFRNSRLLGQAIEYQRTHGMSLGGEFYTSLTVEALLQMNPAANVRVFEIERFFQWGTPEDLHDFEYWERTFHEKSRQSRAEVAQVLMPMAGRGSRFVAMSDKPKPLIPLPDGRPMFIHALNSLPEAKNVSLVTLESFAAEVQEAVRELDSNPRVRNLRDTPPGQAFSTREGLELLEAEGNVLVSACDHAIVLSEEVWNRFHQETDCDAAVFVVRGYPGSSRRPDSYSYVETEQGLFGKVKRVSLKKPVTDIPLQDALLLGTFWFKNRDVLDRGIRLAENESVRLNGELYLDSIFDCLIRAGYDVRVLPVAGYIGWGDPESFQEAVYWQQVFDDGKPSI